jgi:DNA polymerase-4
MQVTNKARKIIHIDMDCYYAAIEMRDNPNLRTVPLAVGGRADRRGVIATCNYLAREYGVHSAMATGYAMKLCPGLVVIPGRMNYYKEISTRIRHIFSRYTDLIEPLSLDEAFLDVTGSDLFRGSATAIAKDIRNTIKNELDLTASAGIAPNKFLAKIGSDENKPDGQFVIPPENVESFVRTLDLGKIPGVGKATLKRLNANQLYTCADVQYWERNQLIRSFGAFGELLYHRCRGIDDRPVRLDRDRKSLSVEHTYPRDILTVSACEEEASHLFDELTARLNRNAEGRLIKTQQLKLKFADFTSTTVERQSSHLDYKLFQALLPIAWRRGKGQGVRLVGLGVSFRQKGLMEEQLSLFN